MRITIARGTLTKEESYKLGDLLMRAGYRDSKETKSLTYIDLDDPKPIADEEDLS